VEATRLQVRVSPGARRASVVGRHGDGWKVRVAAPPEKGRANDALVHLLANVVDVPASAVVVVSGHGARDKIVELTGVAPSDVERRLISVAGKEPA
jgi:uncharacterized protein (TIGR00251 family)